MMTVIVAVVAGVAVLLLTTAVVTPTMLVRLVALAYPAEHPRRAELVAEIRARSPIERFVLATELLEAVARDAGRARRATTPTRTPSPTAPALPSDAEFFMAWDRVGEWGLHDITQIEIVLARIEELRDYYRHHARPGLRQPLGRDVERSRYDFLLDLPDDNDQLINRVTWISDGAEVVRHVIRELQGEVTTFANPRPTRGSTRRFSRLYQDLRCLNAHLDAARNNRES